MIALSVAKLKTFTPESEISFGIKQKKNVFVESLDHFRSLEISEKVRNVFVMSLRLSDHEVLHNIASSSTFFDFARIFSLFLLVFRTSKLLEFKEFNKTIIPFALVGYESGYSQLGATCLVGYLSSHVQRVLMEWLLIIQGCG